MATRKPTRKSVKKSTKRTRTSAKTSAKRPAKKAAKTSDRVVVENVNVPGYTTTLDATKYRVVRQALLAVLPRKAPGLTQGGMLDAILTKLPEEHFPGGDKAAWWTKSVQLDLEAKGIITRETTKPIRWHKV